MAKYVYCIEFISNPKISRLNTYRNRLGRLFALLQAPSMPYVHPVVPAPLHSDILVLLARLALYARDE